MLGLCFCTRASSSCGKRGPLFIAVRGLLTIVASLVAENRLQMRRLSICGSRAQLLRGMQDPPRPGLEPMSPALAGRFSTTAPSGKPNTSYFSLLPHCIGYHFKSNVEGNSLAVQWLGFHASTAGGPGSIPSWGTKIPKLCGLAKYIN